MTESLSENKNDSQSFFTKEGVVVSQIEVGNGIPLGIKTVSNGDLGIAGAYGAWGNSYDNASSAGFCRPKTGGATG